MDVQIKGAGESLVKLILSKTSRRSVQFFVKASVRLTPAVHKRVNSAPKTLV